MKREKYISDETVIKRANAAVKIELEKNKALGIPVVIYDRENQAIYQEDENGIWTEVGKRMRKECAMSVSKMHCIRRVSEQDFDSVKNIVQTTIREIYPKYYPVGAVTFFAEHHADENIKKDIVDGKVYLLRVDGGDKGTVTVNGNEIDRLFVLPDSQHNGYGKVLLSFAESVIKQNYDSIILAASFPAKKIYKRHGYVETEYYMIETENGDFLCFDRMKKEI